MHGSIWPVTMPPGHIPWDLPFFSLVVFYFRAPDRPHICFLGTSFWEQYWFLCNSKTRRLQKFYESRVVTKISSCRVFVVSSRGSRKQSGSSLPPQKKFLKCNFYRFPKGITAPKKAIFIKSTAIISSFMMITSLLKKSTTFWDTKIISFFFT